MRVVLEQRCEQEAEQRGVDVTASEEAVEKLCSYFEGITSLLDELM